MTTIYLSREEVFPDPLTVAGIDVHFRKYFREELPIIGGVHSDVVLILEQPARVKTFIREVPVTNKNGNFVAPWVTIRRRAHTEEEARKSVKRRWRQLALRLTKTAKEKFGDDIIIVEGSPYVGSLTVKRATVDGQWDAEKLFQLIAFKIREDIMS